MPPCQPLERERKREVTAWLTTGVAAESKTGGGGGSLAGWLPRQRLGGLVGPTRGRRRSQQWVGRGCGEYGFMT